MVADGGGANKWARGARGKGWDGREGRPCERADVLTFTRDGDEYGVCMHVLYVVLRNVWASRGERAGHTAAFSIACGIITVLEGGGTRINPRTDTPPRKSLFFAGKWKTGSMESS